MLSTKQYKTFGEFWRYVVTGLINVVIDYGVLLILSSITGITGGNGIIPLNIISFSLATTNSYFMNRYWSFAVEKLGHKKQFALFWMVSIIGVLINTTIVRIITTEVHRPASLDASAWLIVSKVAASVITILWNFSGYKWIVFKK